MNEFRMDPVPPPSPPLPAQPPVPRYGGSLVLGVALAWIINVVGGFALLALATVGRTILPSRPFLLAGLNGLPLLASVLLGAWMVVKGPRRTGIGVFIGIGSIFAVGILLVAACFGLVLMISR
jgi:hypothetical protein